MPTVYWACMQINWHKPTCDVMVASVFYTKLCWLFCDNAIMVSYNGRTAGHWHGWWRGNENGVDYGLPWQGKLALIYWYVSLHNNNLLVFSYRATYFAATGVTPSGCACSGLPSTCHAFLPHDGAAVDGDSEN